MNQTAKINGDLAKTFLSAGIVLLALVGVIFVYKYVTGYTNATFYKNVPGCSVSVSKVRKRRYSRHGRRYYTVYTVQVYNEAEGIDMTISHTGRKAYQGFLTYNGRNDVTLSFFMDSNDKMFPVYHVNCSEHEAEKIYAQLYPPTFWRMLYYIFGGLGVMLVSAGLNALRVAKRYVDAPAVRTVTSPGFDDEFDRAAAGYAGRKGMRMSEAPKSDPTGKTEKTLSEAERDELLKEFDDLTSGGRFDSKLRK